MKICANLWLIKDSNPAFFLLNLLNLCEPKGASVRRASVRFSTRRAKPWDLWDLCEALGRGGEKYFVRFVGFWGNYFLLRAIWRNFVG